MESCLGAEMREVGEGGGGRVREETKKKKKIKTVAQNLTPSHHLMAYTPAQLQPSGGWPNRVVYSHTERGKGGGGAKVK